MKRRTTFFFVARPSTMAIALEAVEREILNVQAQAHAAVQKRRLEAKEAVIKNLKKRKRIITRLKNQQEAVSNRYV